ISFEVIFPSFNFSEAKYNKLEISYQHSARPDDASRRQNKGLPELSRLPFENIGVPYPYELQF
ncbi:MAG: hypothetical protein WC061_11265, partial [Melioribacteraceae bacterium]